MIAISEYIAMFESGEMALEDILKSAMEASAEDAIDEFRSMLCVDRRLEEVTSSFNNALDGKFGSKEDVARYFIDLHIASGNEPKIVKNKTMLNIGRIENGRN